MRTRAHALVFWALVFRTLLGGPLLARAAPEVPADRQVLILTRALAYDRALRSRAGDAVVVAVLSRAGDAASERMAEAMVRAFRALSGIKVQGLPLQVLPLSFTGEAQLGEAVAGHRVGVLYVCAGLEAQLQAIEQVSRKGRVLTIGARAEYVHKGLSLGVFPVDSKNTIMINLKESRSEGVDFSTELLRLAEIIR